MPRTSSVSELNGQRPSVIVRSLDSAGTIAATLAALRAQTVDVEVVVVDSGSTDDTLAIAGRWCDRIAHIGPGAYSPGRALNLGAAEASGEILFALSSHCAPARPDWIERTLAHYAEPTVGAVAGVPAGPNGRPLTDMVIQTSEQGRQYPRWGFSNHASSWRRAVWAVEPFDESLAALEDKEWAWRILDRDWTIALDPELWIDQAHRWRAGAAAYFRRERAEQSVLARIVGMPPLSLSDLARNWWETPDTERDRLFHLLNYRRAAGLIGQYLGDREARQ